MKRADVLQLTATLQAAVLAAACSYDRALPHPLKARRTQVAHLLRRAGFGADKEMLDEYEALGLAGAIDRLVEYDNVEDDVDSRVAMFTLDQKKLGDLQRGWLLRLIYTKRPLQEKMVLFWHGLLTSGSSKVGLPNPTPQNPSPPHHMLNQHNFFRTHATDHFESILSGISRDPAMIIWLDSQTNNKGKPNENYARELLELFTLGIGNYTEQDVREVARAFTGWGLEAGKFVFRPANHDGGMKTVLGKTGNLDGQDVIKLLAEHPLTARHLAYKLFDFFAYAHPSDKDLEPLVTAYVRTNGSVQAMLRALFTSPRFYAPEAYRVKIKSPVEFTVGAMRTLGVVTDGAALPGLTTRMGQALFNPPDVAGWPGGATWLNSISWVERVNFCNAILTARTAGATTSPPLMAIAERNNLKTSAAAVEYFADLLLDGQLSQSMRQTLLGYLTGSGRLTAQLPAPAARTALPSGTLTPVSPAALPTFIDHKVRGMVYLMLASPEYQLS